MRESNHYHCSSQDCWLISIRGVTHRRLSALRLDLEIWSRSHFFPFAELRVFFMSLRVTKNTFHEETRRSITKRHEGFFKRVRSVCWWRFFSARLVGAAVLLLVLGAPLNAQKVGTTSFQFMKVMPTARAIGMGEAFSTLAIGADAVFWNPAGVARAASQELSTTLTLWLFDTKQTALAYCLPLGEWGTIALQGQYVDFGQIEETSTDPAYFRFIGTGDDRYFSNGLTGRMFSPRAYLFGAAYARSMTDHFSMGIAAKYAKEMLWDQSTFSYVNSSGATETYNTFAGVFLFDFGMQYNTGFRSVQLGLSVQNFGSQVKFAKEEHPVPMTFRLGIAADLIGAGPLFMESEDHVITFAYDLIQPNDYQQQMHYGVEYTMFNILSLRGGYKMNYDADGLTFGAGVRTMVEGYRIAVDYSYSDMGKYLGQAHRISLGATL